MPVTVNFQVVRTGTIVEVPIGKYSIVCSDGTTCFVNTPYGWRQLPSSKTVYWTAENQFNQYSFAAGTVNFYREIEIVT